MSEQIAHNQHQLKILTNYHGMSCNLTATSSSSASFL
jgi:hypothetical protein